MERGVRASLPAQVLVPHAGARHRRRSRVSVELTAETTPPGRSPRREARGGLAPCGLEVRMYTDAWTEVDLFRREDLSVGDVVAGPAVIAEANATTVVDPGWRARVTDHNHLMLERTQPRRRDPRSTPRWIPVMLELFNNLFMSDRRADGRAASGHRQLGEHQGAAGLLLRALRPRRPPDRQCAAHARPPGVDGRVDQGGHRREPGSIRPGDAYVLNNPYRGGTHLPDITVVTPVFDPARTSCSTSPPGATTPRSAASHTGLDAGVQHHGRRGGVLIDNHLLTRERPDAGRGDAGPARRVGAPRAVARRTTWRTCAGCWPPTRRAWPSSAAWSRSSGSTWCMAYMGHVRQNAAEAVRGVISALRDGSYRYELDSGAVIEVAVTVDHEQRSATSTSRVRRSSSRTTPMRPPRWRWPRSFTCSGRSSTTRSRSTPAASSRSR